MTLSVFICDDEPIILHNFEKTIASWIMINDYDMKLVLATSNSYQISEYIKDHDISDSLFFLDIDLGGQSGIDLAQQIREVSDFAQIVFLTSHGELAIETLRRQIAPLNYIVKGETAADQIKEVLDDRDKHRYINGEHPEKYLKVQTGTTTTKIDMEKIYYIETSVTPHKVCLYGEELMLEFYGKLNDIADDNPEFFRAHKSFLINPEKIVSIDFKNRIIFFPEEYSCTFPLRTAKTLKRLMDSGTLDKK